MPYIANIPLSTDRLKDSQSQLLGNFQALGAIAFNGNPNSNLLNAAAGFNFMYLPVQGAQPNFIATTTNIWTQLNNIVALGNTNQRELFIKTDTANTAANQGIPITSAVKAVNGWTWLPSGILLQWGIYPVVEGPFPPDRNFPIPFPTACLNVQATVQYTNAPNTVPTVYNFTNTKFNARFFRIDQTQPVGLNNFYFFAIGY